MAIPRKVSTFALGTAIFVGQGTVFGQFSPTASKPSQVKVSVVDSSPAKSSRPVVSERYPNGKPKITREVALDNDDNFVSHGEYTVFTPGGGIVGGGQYHMGRKTGKWTRTYENGAPVLTEHAAGGFVGPFTSTATFKHDRLHGDWSISDSKKRPVVLWQFSEGDREGQWLWFNPDGTTRKQIHYKEGQIAGDIVAAGGEDDVEVLTTFVEGRELTKHLARYSVRQVKSEGFLLKPREVTRVSVDWWAGEMASKVVSREGDLDRHGAWRFLYPNGKVRMEGTYDRGKETGLHVWYHENGQKSSEGYFYDGKKQGRWEMWYANGARKTAGVCVDGEHDGIWMSWHENGMPKLQAHYVNGQVSESKSWNNSGKRIESIARKTTKTRVAEAAQPQKTEESQVNFK